jgi:hypothetical protein
VAALLLASGTASAIDFDRSATDPAGDVVERVGTASFTVDRPSLDLLEVVTRPNGNDVVEAVRLAAPLDPNATLTLHDQIGEAESHALTLTYLRSAAVGVQVLAFASRPGSEPSPVTANASAEASNVTFHFRASDLPAWAICFDPAAVTGLIEVHNGTETHFEDLLNHGPTACPRKAPDAGAAGLAGLGFAAWAVRRPRR